MRRLKENISSCRRCGACCEKGGPTLHIEDREIVESGVVPARRLVTIRAGEPVNDPRAGRVVWADSEMIKIKGSDDRWTCHYYLEETATCRIYDHRPIECRVMKCWDTRDIERIYGLNLLTREMLLGKMAGIWDLVEDHHQRCNYQRVRDLSHKIRFENSQCAMAELEQMIRYDRSIRELVLEQAGIQADMLDFLFGRPMTVTLAGFGFQVIQKDESNQIVIRLR